MRPYFYHVFLLQFHNIALIKSDISSENEAEINAQGAVYSDVIKNITRVNSALEDLIKNYEALQNIYKSDETFEKDYSLDTDEEYKKNKKLNRSRKKTTTKNPEDIATQMFLSDEESNYKNHKKNKVDTKKEKIKSGPKKGKEFKRESKKIKHKTVKNKIKEKKEHKKIKTVKNKTKEIDRIPNVEYLKEKTDEPKLHDTGKQTDSYTDDDSYNEEDSEEIEHLNLEHPLDKKAERQKNPETPKKPITYTIKRYELINSPSGGTINAIRDKTIKVSLVNNSKPVWKIIRSEDFSNTNIWDEIRKNKPVHLKKENEIIYNYRVSIEPANSTIKSNIEENNRRMFFGVRKNLEADSKESAEFNETAVKDQFKTSILRKAYGDACLKVVVKKCHKACKHARKDACNKYHCKKRFKREFTANAKTGCIQEFKETTSNNKQNNAYYAYRATGNNGGVNLDDGFHDITRNGYLAAACLPNQLRTAQELPDNSTGKELNILRDRLERACQKVSSKKCIEACKWATNKTCTTYSCDSKTKKAFKTSCKKGCKESYDVSTTDTSDSDSDGSKDSSSSSSSDDNTSKTDKKNGDKEKKKSSKEEKKRIKEEIKAKLLDLIKKKKEEGKEVNLMDYFENGKDKKGSGDSDDDDKEEKKEKEKEEDKKERKKKRKRRVK